MQLFETEGLVPQNYYVNIDLESFFQNLQKEPEKLKRIRAAFPKFFQEYKRRMGRSPSIEQQEKRMKSVVSEAAKLLDTELSFIAPSPIQATFERLIFLPNTGYFQKLNNLIATFRETKPQDFVQGIIDVADSIRTIFQIQGNECYAMIVTLLFRAIFDEVYPEVDNFKSEIDYMDILVEVSEVTVEELAPPLEYCPPMEPNDRPGRIFRQEPNFRRAIDRIEQCAFFTNPLDIIHHVHLCLHEIEIAAARNRHSTGISLLLSFDVTFGLFLCSLLGAEMPEYLRISEFTKMYAPGTGLSPAFSFALMKLKAATAYLTTMCQDKANERLKSSE
jgi:hypothetical protein